MNFAVFAQQTGSLSGQIGDTLGASVVGATVTVVSADGKEKTATSDQSGEFTVTGLSAGTYIVRVTAPNFAFYENSEVVIAAGQRQSLNVALTVEALEEQVEVSDSDTVSTDPNNNASATVLKEGDLEALPDDPDDLEAALQALAGPSAGPNGGQIYIDGFTGGRLPPKEAIREIRLNQNPFSAEFDRLGFGRIEILTKPGSDKWRGQAFLNFNDESLNSRNPFALNRAPSQTRFFGGSVSGPIQKGKSSFFLDVSNRQVDNNAVVNARILDASLNPFDFREEFQVPNRRFSISPRFDYQINANNTLVARYSFTSGSVENQGIGDVSLPTRAYITDNIEHEIRLTETMIINAKTVNETRFQYEFEKREQLGDNSIPTINVANAFTGGGSQIGLSFNRSNSWELQNYTTTALGKNSEHSVKFGVRLRGNSFKDRSENNFGGTFSFGGAAEVLSAPGCDRTVTGCILLPAISPLDQYRQRLLGSTDPRVVPTQFSLVTGDPLESISQTDVGLFITDDWRFSPALTLSFGLRYENQTNISDNSNFAPRFSFAWSPGAGGARAPKTVIRGGIGVFYERFSDNLVLQSERFDGASQLSFLVSANDPDPVRRAAAIALLSQPVFTLNGVSNVPTAAQIQTLLPSSSIVRTIADDLNAPYTIQTTLGVERQLPARTTLSLFYIASRTLHQLRARNINAPICPLQVNCNNAPRPDPTGNAFQYQYESSGISNQNQFIANFRTFLSNKFSLFGNYRLGYAKSDTDGAGSFPAYTYDTSDEYGRSSFDIRHSFFLGGNFTMPWNISVSPFIIANSGRPFNITRGEDRNGDGLFTERPTYGEVSARCAFLRLDASFCDIAGNDPNAIIPRNYAQSPNFFTVNLRIGKNFGFGSSGATQAAQTGGQGGQTAGGGNPGGGRGRQGGGGRGPGGPGGFGGFGGGGNERKPYNLNVGLNFNNLFNTVNLGTPVGSLNSTRFGQSTSTSGGFGGFGGGGGGGAANRRVELQMRFSW